MRNGGYDYNTGKFAPDTNENIRTLYIKDIELLSEYDRRVKQILPYLRKEKLKQILS